MTNEADLRNIWEIRRQEWKRTGYPTWCNLCDDKYSTFCDCEYQKCRQLQFGKNIDPQILLKCYYCASLFGNKHSGTCLSKLGEIPKWLNNSEKS